MPGLRANYRFRLQTYRLEYRLLECRSVAWTSTAGSFPSKRDSYRRTRRQSSASNSLSFQLPRKRFDPKLLHAQTVATGQQGNRQGKEGSDTGAREGRKGRNKTTTTTTTTDEQQKHVRGWEKNTSVGKAHIHNWTDLGAKRVHS